jgi:hypothetical protein
MCVIPEINTFIRKEGPGCDHAFTILPAISFPPPEPLTGIGPSNMQKHLSWLYVTRNFLFVCKSNAK